MSARASRATIANLTQVTWANNRGGAGTASGTSSWSATVALQVGTNVITMTARDAANNTSTDTLTVTFSDVTVPPMSIISPTSASTYTTGSSSVSLSGTASDNIGVSQVTWSNHRGGSGTATGTANWTATFSLYPGENVITVTARDGSNNTSTDTLAIT